MPFLSGCTIAITGDFGQDATLPKMQSWLRAAGALYSPSISTQVTHLVCSQEHFKKRAPMVRQALAHSSIKIVSFDWLEDCLLRRAKRAVRDDYLVANQVKARRSAKTARKKARQKAVRDNTSYFAQTLSTVQRSLQHPGYTLHLDPLSGSAWDAKLVRVTASAIHRVRLRLAESIDVAPKHFAAYADFRGPVAHYTQVLCRAPAEFAEAKAAFVAKFKELVGYEWERRFDGWERTEGRWLFEPEMERERERREMSKGKKGGEDRAEMGDVKDEDEEEEED